MMTVRFVIRLVMLPVVFIISILASMYVMVRQIVEVIRHGPDY